MPRLPTVKLRRKKDGHIIIMNQTQYAREVNVWVRRGYEIVSMRRGDATTEQIVEDAVAQELEETRYRDPAREKRFGDRQRLQDERAIRQNVVTEEPKEKQPEKSDGLTLAVETVSAPLESPPPWDEIRAMKWMAARWKVRDLTGSIPTSWDEAEELYRAKFG